MSEQADLSNLVAQIDKANALALACQDPAERMRYAQMKRALEHDLARDSGLKDFGFTPSENNPISGNPAE